MDKIVGICFRKGGKIFHFDAGHFVLKQGDEVIVKTDKGLGFGFVATRVRERNPDVPAHQKLKEVFRLATDEDRRQYKENLERAREAYDYCKDRIDKLGLPMRLVDVEGFFDGSQIIFYFCADGRVDFRELVKELVKKLRTRIELRQIGVRNKAKMIGALGPCGRELCCSAFLADFHSVSVKMAKEQNLSLNPTKISGACGRLMCCLKYEYDTYMELKKGTPKIGKRVLTPSGPGKVVRQDVLGQLVSVLLDTEKEMEFPVSQVVLERQEKQEQGNGSVEEGETSIPETPLVGDPTQE
jgi:cell fate regulator YaaT (PSP1 superfamily)